MVSPAFCEIVPLSPEFRRCRSGRNIVINAMLPALVIRAALAFFCRDPDHAIDGANSKSIRIRKLQRLACGTHSSGNVVSVRLSEGDGVDAAHAQIGFRNRFAGALGDIATGDQRERVRAAGAIGPAMARLRYWTVPTRSMPAVMVSSSALIRLSEPPPPRLIGRAALFGCKVAIFAPAFVAPVKAMLSEV